jgi:hypothetical protein
MEQHDEAAVSEKLATTTIKRLLNGRHRFEWPRHTLAEASAREVTEAAPSVLLEWRDPILHAQGFARQTQKYIKDPNTK